MRKISVVLVLSLICFFCVNMSSYATSFSNDIVVGDDCDGGSCPLPPDGDDGDDQGGCDGGSCPLPDDKLTCGDGDDSCPLPPDGDDGDDQGGCD
ncbi:hypothetical protein KAJ27_14765, partial [bacterium]|nr:hypothetical protein [bacterium]